MPMHILSHPQKKENWVHFSFSVHCTTLVVEISGFLTQFMGCEPELFLLRLRFGNLRLCTLIWDRQKTRVLSAAAVAVAAAVSKQSVKLFFLPNNRPSQTVFDWTDQT